MLRFYLTEVHALGAELSISATLAPAHRRDARARRRSPDRSPHRDDEPYRRALIGMYARLAATLQELTGTERCATPWRRSTPYAGRPAILADLRIIERRSPPPRRSAGRRRACSR